MKPIIETPRGAIYKTGNTTSRLVWNTNFQPKWQGGYSRAQIFIDSEVLRLSEPYTPLLTGTMIKSSQLGTVPGEGVVSWIAPYSRKRYYTPRKSPSTTGPLRGPFWFERMKSVWKNTIIAGAKKLAGIS
jgi:hypothetical protein